MGHIPSIKFKDWELADNDKFLELAEDKLLSQKWLLGVEKAGLLNLKWIPHYHCMTITMYVI